MITGFFLSALLALLSFIVGLLPVIAFPPQIASAVALFWSYVNLFSMVIPVGTILTVLLLILTYESVKLIWSALHWVLRRRKQ